MPCVHIQTSPALATSLSSLLGELECETGTAEQADFIFCDRLEPASALATEHPQALVVLVADEVSGDLVKSGIADWVRPADLGQRLPLLVGKSTNPQAQDFVAAMSEVHAGIAISTNGVIKMANAKLAELLMNSQEELIGSEAMSLIHADSRPAVLKSHREYVLKNASPPPQRVLMLRADGVTIAVERFVVPVRFAGRRSVFELVIGLPNYSEDLMLGDRLASVGTLAAGIAHELNNPLAYVLTNLQLCREEAKGETSRLLEQLDVTIDGAHRMADILRDLHTFSRSPSGTSDVVDVREAFQSALQICENEIRHRGELVLHVHATPNVEINTSRLVQVFVNLLINAAHAIEDVEGGVIEVTIQTDKTGRAHVSIKDNGPGIPAEQMPRIFEPFFTTKPGSQGTGLGLSICRNVVTGAGGEMRVESIQGEGSRFELFLPACDQPLRRDRAAAGSTKSSRKARILVIDDERLIGRAMERALREHDVTFVQTGAEGLDLIATEKLYDLVLCDLMMPSMSGMELFERATKQNPEVASKFVFMTGGAFTERAKAFLETTGRTVIDKPFNLSQLRTLAAKSVSGESEAAD